MQSAQLIGVGPFGIGLGLTDDELDDIAEGMDDATKTEIVEALRLLDPKDRVKLGQKLLVRGLDAQMVREAVEEVGQSIPFWMDPEKRKIGITVWSVLGTVSMVASAYHGYVRNQSIGWALWWGFMGSLFPVITPTIALAQCKAGPENRFKLGCRK